jgi:hypothetical protein
MLPGERVGKEEVLELKNELRELKEASYKFKKESQEYKAKHGEREMKEVNKNPDNQIEGYIIKKSEENFREIMEGKKEADSLTLLLLGMSRLFDRMDKIEEGIAGIKLTIRNSMCPIWISIVAGIVTYVIINVLGI